MSVHSILVPLLPREEPAAPPKAAAQLACRFAAHLDGLFIRSDPASDAGVGGATRHLPHTGSLPVLMAH
ncbi:hypothetical protein GCM10011611_57420 [Aliidongia dinghuensis]|uniref:Uncharacterized protein n=2 Tax=Aliidongia dinghuensis TaxID=1867774 RepID=A0A8J2Z062_9PROT|nr:hypothetical protein GCM10011611_57420 [Aliidongia dinghuensis]